MFRQRTSIIVLVTLGITMSGCQHDDPRAQYDEQITEFVPGSPPIEKPAPVAGDYALWGWEPGKATGEQSAARPHWLANVHAEKNYPLGFRNRSDRLIAYAGPTTMQLTTARYCWRTTVKVPRGPDTGRIVAVILTGGLIGVLQEAIQIVTNAHPDPVR